MVITLFVLFREISDQYGTTEVVGIFSTPERAQHAESMIKNRRTIIKPMSVDAIPANIRES